MTLTLLWAGCALGCTFGVASRLGDFCLLRGLRQRLAGGAAPQLQAFALALAVALLASQALAWAGLADLGSAQLVRPQFSLPAVLLGGLLFGSGMALARSCGARALVLLAGGHLRALVTLLCLGLAAQATLTGVLAPLRQWLQALGTIHLSHATLAQQLQAQGLGLGLATLGAAAVPALALLGYALGPPALRRTPVQLLCALVIGTLVAAGWWLTAQVGVDPFEPTPLTSLSFIGPVAEGLFYLQLATGRAASLGPAIVAGTLLGAGATALATRSARWEGFAQPRALAASACGGVLMGVGGVLAVGCSIGQGLSGLSTLAYASLPACAGIVAGALLTLQAHAYLFPALLEPSHETP
ncbi:YeeE/YedE family protein [Acidovorax sp. HDW3]|uniref:YeeE/YedE thiosulfate transporter family protein n=1 Tax=Acidovorax sp. HDW3 TaxID=2714923 RepID=UPI0014083E97|nr:YeeE/YedE thiosulfate transporter family protein [Acidovorax sp. HDW3]QIL44697.1 YeeE/YedE family protein [Acidovorax sp. HDW3]